MFANSSSDISAMLVKVGGEAAWAESANPKRDKQRIACMCSDEALCFLCMTGNWFTRPSWVGNAILTRESLQTPKREEASLDLASLPDSRTRRPLNSFHVAIMFRSW